MSDCKELLKELFREARFFDARDLLVNPERNPAKVISISAEQERLVLEGNLKGIIRESKAIKKDSGNEALCITHDLVGTIDRPLFPLFLEICPFKQHKISGEIQLLRSNEWILNPYLSVFCEQLDVRLGSKLEASLFESDLDAALQEEIRTEIQYLGLHLERGKSYLGNFHPHRFSHLKDLDLLIQGATYSNVLLQLSGDDFSENNPIELSSSFLFQSDVDQRRAIELSTKHNLALLGPPGTGKSQFLTNLLAKLVFAGQSTLVLSEKRTALEVIQKRLKERNLEHLSSIQTTQGSSSDFIFQLKDNWSRLESDAEQKSQKISRYDNLSRNLQFYLDVLNQPETIGGLSLNDFLKRCPNPELNGTFFLSPPLIKEVEEREAELDAFYKKGGNKLLGMLNEQLLLTESSTAILDTLIGLKQKVEELTLHFGEIADLDLDSLIQRAAWAQVAQSDYYRKHCELFDPGSTKQKQLLQGIKKWRKVHVELGSIEVQQHWKRSLHREELKTLRTHLSSKRGIFHSAKRDWKKLSHAPFDAAQHLIADQLKIAELQNKLQNIEAQLKSLGLEATETEIILFEQWLKQYNSKEWHEIQLLSTQIIAGEQNIHAELNRTKKGIVRYFKTSSLKDVLLQIDTILKSKADFIVICKLAENWSRELLKMAVVASTRVELKKNLYHSHWLLFSEQYPGMSSFKYAMLRDKLKELQQESEMESERFAESIRAKQEAKFRQFETLLRTPANKLTQEEKDLKTLLRKGKSILSKEFAKKTRHLSLHELYKSEARNWIQVLIPIMLCNTEQISRAFPLELNLFDVGIFDEASQVPLYTAVGAAQRCKKLVVAGDDQQMRPSRPFGSGKDDVIDLLSQSLMYFKRSTLRHHYRSEHEELIAFSNRHFYNNELIAYPSFPREKEVIKLVPCKGEYKERKNEKEARALVPEIDRLLRESANFGVVAFSEEQIGLVWSLLPPTTAEALQDAIDEDRAFIKAVDKVQGDECDHLLISFTFGFNNDGQFKYTFGPMSTVHGTNRLNVLLTRARKTIQFYTSVSYSDFRISPNPSIELIRKYFAFIESPRTEAEIRFPHELQALIENNKLTFPHIGSSIQDAQELVTLFNVLENRGWEVNFV